MTSRIWIIQLLATGCSSLDLFSSRLTEIERMEDFCGYKYHTQVSLCYHNTNQDMLYQILIAAYFCTHLVDGHDHQQSKIFKFVHGGLGLSGGLEISSDWCGKVNENELANLLAITALRFETEVRGAKLIALSTNMTTWNASCGSLFFENNKLTCTVSITHLSLYIFHNSKVRFKCSNPVTFNRMQ